MLDELSIFQLQHARYYTQDFLEKSMSKSETWIRSVKGIAWFACMFEHSSVRSLFLSAWPEHETAVAGKLPCCRRCRTRNSRTWEGDIGRPCQHARSRSDLHISRAPLASLQDSESLKFPLGAPTKFLAMTSSSARGSHKRHHYATYSVA